MFATAMSDLPTVLADGDLQVRGADHDGMTIAHFQLPAGTDLRPALKGLPGDLCQCPHWGYMLKGTLRMHTADGSQDFTAGQAFYWAAGHGPEALDDCEYVDFSPSEELGRVVAHILSGGASSA
jgi:hypothetical protein